MQDYQTQDQIFKQKPISEPAEPPLDDFPPEFFRNMYPILKKQNEKLCKRIGEQEEVIEGQNKIIEYFEKKNMRREETR